MKKYNLTASQKLLLYFQLLNRKTSYGNICGSLTIQEKVDFEKLKKAINLIVEKNDSMRTRLCFTVFGFKQYFEDFKEFDIEIINVKTDDDVKKIEDIISHEVFSMLNSPLFKVIFFKYPDGTGGIVACMHHIICDAWTIGLVINEMMNYYSENEENIVSYSYYEHVKDEKNYLSSFQICKSKIFWKNLFKDNIPPPADIDGDLNKKDKSSKSKFLKVHLDEDVINSINEYCIQNRISVCTFFTGVFSLYIGIESKLNNFMLDTIISNRANYRDKHTTGLYAKTLPFNVIIREGTFRNYITNINKDLTVAYKYYKYPTSKILKIIKKKDATRKRASKIWFSFQNAKTGKDSFKVPFITRWTPLKTTYLYDILIELYDLEYNGGLDIIYYYLESKYSIDRAHQIHEGINRIINQVLENDEIEINQINIDNSKSKNDSI